MKNYIKSDTLKIIKQPIYTKVYESRKFKFQFKCEIKESYRRYDIKSAIRGILRGNVQKYNVRNSAEILKAARIYKAGMPIPDIYWVYAGGKKLYFFFRKKGTEMQLHLIYWGNISITKPNQSSSHASSTPAGNVDGSFTRSLFLGI